MPNRILKDSICISEDINKLSWFDEVVFYRLIVNCDDYGRFDGRGEILKSMLFPLKDGKITIKSVMDAIHRLEAVGLLILYEHNNRPYLQLRTWEKHQQVRAKKSKFPAPDSDSSHPLSLDSNCKQMISDDSNCTRNPIQSQSESNPKKDARLNALGEFDGELRQTLDDWLRYKSERREAYKPTGLRNLLAQVRNKRALYSDAQICALISECMANGWRGIIWDKLNASSATKPKCKADQMGCETSLDMEKIHTFLHGEAGH